MVAFLLLPAVITGGQHRRPATQSQKERARVTAQMEQLRDEYITATKDYKVSLEKLLPLYEASRKMAEARLEQNKEQFKQGLVSKADLEASERGASGEQAKIDEVRSEMTKADEQLTQIPTTAELVREQIAEERKHRRVAAHQPACQNWTLTASRHQRGRTVTVAFKLVCKY